MNGVVILCFLCICALLIITLTFNIKKTEYKKFENNYNTREDFEGFNNETGTSNGCYIIPNIVHFLRFNQPNITFVEMICILAAYKNQKPDNIYIHTDLSHLYGHYWEYILNIKKLRDIIQLKYIEVPKHIFGQKLNYGFFHRGDIARLNILIKYGGIFLDNDSYIVKNLNEFRKYEMTLGWAKNGNLSNQVIIAHKNARFLNLWLETYRNNYNQKSWFYNAGIRPTQEVLVKKPYLIHRMYKYMAEYRGMIDFLYIKKNPNWIHHYAIHLLIRHQYLISKNLTQKATYPVIFNENNIQNYPITFQDMVASVYPFE